MAKILKEVRQFVEDRALVKNGDRVLIAVSGGPDSVFLFYFFQYLKKFHRISFSVAYIHHHLRKEADEELKFVELLAKKYKAPFYYRDIQIEGKSGIEEKARRERYKALYSIAKKANCNKIAVGHNLDDQVETVIMRFIKGAGIAGLGGISPERHLFPKSKITVIRPLLCLEKKDIMEFLEGKQIEYRKDETNLSTDFFRNRIRLEVIPFLSKYNPQLKKKIAQMSFLIQDDFSFIISKGYEAFKKIVKEDVLNMVEYRKLDISIKRMVAGILIEKITGDPYRSYNKIRQLVEYLDRYPGKKLPINGVRSCFLHPLTPTLSPQGRGK
ncbi:MAG: tRNA lysidine(34) synthetase TilS [Candidatus Omnitrophica bacterium]|nr:tRNA lysidine(34) synthetase TilS [Candidatus Omnitrophota bacterium]